MDQTPSGLSEAQAREALVRFGHNELPPARRRDLWAVSRETLREPMFLLLIGAALLYLGLGELGEGLFMLLGAFASIGLVIFQETRSERALDALRELSQPLARVLRDGQIKQIPARDIVPGDIILLAEGDRAPADALLISGDMMMLDESLLTGESAPVSKRPALAGEQFGAHAADPQEPTPLLFAGTLVVRGQGEAEVRQTGPRSALGKIGAALVGLDPALTPLQQTAGRLVGLMGFVAMGFCLLVVVAFGALRNDWAGGALAGLTVAIGLIPEEFPMVLAIFLAMGAWRLARRNVLVRRSAIIETLGGATILCVDKTGTLTQNHMRVERLWASGRDAAFSAEALVDTAARDLITTAGRASNRRAIDPMDRAIAEATEGSGISQAFDAPERIWPLRPELMAVVQLFGSTDGVRIAAAKGAPEAVFWLCRLDETRVQSLNAVIADFAAQGLRVLGVARSNVTGEFPDDPLDALFEFVGLIGFLDPLRSDVPAALKEANAAGIRVMMITGDHPQTARAIAAAAGIDVSGGVLSGVEIAALPLPTLRERLRQVRVFARVAPEQKFLLVEALKANGEIVAMTGDGVNDAPALEAAHIGIAMGQRGAAVAREAADLILLDDSFASIVGGVRLGRRIFANLQKALTFVTAVHVPIAGLALAPVVMGLPQFLYPMHVVMLELAIDPICALAFEGERTGDDAMKRPPRRPFAPLFGPAEFATALLQGAGVLATVLGLYAWADGRMTQEQARGLAFTALVVAVLALALVDAAGRDGQIIDPRRGFYWAIAGVLLALLALVFFAPVLSALFRLALPPSSYLGLPLLVAIAAGGWSWVLTRLARTD
jgi:P-type Ca2+ transporter type 2C